MCLQGLFVVSWWQHHSILGTWGQGHPSQSDSDAVTFPPGDSRPQPLQRGGLQTALAEKRGLPVCESGQDSERNAGTQKKEGTQGLVLRKGEIFKGIFETCQGVVTNFEIFRMREKQVPVDVVEMKGEDRG